MTTDPTTTAKVIAKALDDNQREWFFEQRDYPAEIDWQAVARIVDTVLASPAPAAEPASGGGGPIPLYLANEVRAEQDHGRAKYGKGPDDYAHDDSHSPQDWARFIRDHAERARDTTPFESRQYFIKVAGLALSAVQSFDRNPALAPSLAASRREHGLAPVDAWREVDRG
jgi:hypothetical protein